MERNELKKQMSEAGFLVNNGADIAMDFVLKKLNQQKPLIGIPVVCRGDFSRKSYLCMTQDYFFLGRPNNTGNDGAFWALWKGDNLDKPWQPGEVEVDAPLVSYLTGYADYWRQAFHDYREITLKTSNERGRLSVFTSRENINGFLTYCKRGRMPSHQPSAAW